MQDLLQRMKTLNQELAALCALVLLVGGSLFYLVVSISFFGSGSFGAGIKQDQQVTEALKGKGD